MPCTNATKTRNPLKFAGVPQTPEPISAVNGPKFTILRGYVEVEVLLLNKFFPIVEDTAQQSRAMVPIMAIFYRYVIFASCISSEPRAAHFRPTS